MTNQRFIDSCNAEIAAIMRRVKQRIDSEVLPTLNEQVAEQCKSEETAAWKRRYEYSQTAHTATIAICQQAESQALHWMQAWKDREESINRAQLMADSAENRVKELESQLSQHNAVAERLAEVERLVRRFAAWGIWSEADSNKLSPTRDKWSDLEAEARRLGVL
jgi:uncharacterized coiled-coil protein SlyX